MSHKYYNKALMVDGKLQRGMYSRGDSCRTLELARITKLLYEQAGAVLPVNGNDRLAVIVESYGNGDEIIVEICGKEDSSVT